MAVASRSLLLQVVLGCCKSFLAVASRSWLLQVVLGCCNLVVLVAATGTRSTSQVRASGRGEHTNLNVIGVTVCEVTGRSCQVYFLDEARGRATRAKRAIERLMGSELAQGVAVLRS